MKILLSNDDGIHAPGLHALYQGLKRFGDVCVVAPLEEKSTTGHALTLHKPLRLSHVGEDFYAVSGSPADCIYLGIREVLKSKPDWVISGINRGANLGQDVYYSGTVSAAREACMLGIPSIAVSLAFQPKKDSSETQLHYTTAAKVLIRIFQDLDLATFPFHTLLNLNVPNLPLKGLKGIRIAEQGFQLYSGSILRRKDHRGKDYYWVGGEYQGFKQNKKTDCFFVNSGYASLTPLKLDATHLDYFPILEQLKCVRVKKK